MKLPPHLLPELLNMPNLRSLKLTSKDFISAEDWAEATQMAIDGHVQHLQKMHICIKKLEPCGIFPNYVIAQESMVKIYNHSPKMVDRMDCILTYDCENRIDYWQA
jgi:hypothetical protein